MRLSGADIVQHSATKYFAGHSDALGGVLVVKSEKEADQLRSDRNVLGSVLGSLEAWLLLRSLRQVVYVYLGMGAILEANERSFEKIWGLPETDGIRLFTFTLEL